MALEDSGGAGGTGIDPGPGTSQQMSDINQARKNLAATSAPSRSTGPDPNFYVPGGMSQAGAASRTSRPALDPKNPNLWMGAQSPIAFMDLSDAKNMYFLWDAKTKNKFMSQLSLAGYDTSNMRDADIASLWSNYVGVSAAYQAAGQHISPWDVLGKDISQHTEQVSKPKTVTQTQTSYNISTAEDAAALFQGAAQTLLGRDPTKAEQARFKQILNKYEQAHPSTTTTTSNYVGQDLQDQSSTTTGGVSAATQQYIAQEEAKKNPEYGAYQAATNGMNWLLQAINGS
jgi:hypothetical protein